MKTKTRKPVAAVKSASKIPTKVDFEFYAPSASQVSLAGTFNKWSADKDLLKRGPDGRWKLSLALKPGRYEYRYSVDGNWQNDQRPVECVPNAFGSWNCVVEVR